MALIQTPAGVMEVDDAFAEGAASLGLPVLGTHLSTLAMPSQIDGASQQYAGPVRQYKEPPVDVMDAFKASAGNVADGAGKAANSASDRLMSLFSVPGGNKENPDGIQLSDVMDVLNNGPRGRAYQPEKPAKGESSKLGNALSAAKEAGRDAVSVIQGGTDALRGVGERARDYALMPASEYDQKYANQAEGKPSSRQDAPAPGPKPDNAALDAEYARRTAGESAGASDKGFQSLIGNAAGKDAMSIIQEDQSGEMPTLTPSVAAAAPMVPDADAGDIYIASAIDRGDPGEISQVISRAREAETSGGGQRGEGAPKRDWGRILGILGYTMSSVSNRPGATLGEALGASSMALYAYFDDLEAKAKAERDAEMARNAEWAKMKIEQANKDRDFQLEVSKENRVARDNALDRASANARNAQSNSMAYLKMMMDQDQFDRRLEADERQFSNKSREDMFSQIMKGHTDYGTDPTDDILRMAEAGSETAGAMAASRIADHVEEISAIYAADGQHKNRGGRKLNRYLRDSGMTPAMEKIVIGVLQDQASNGNEQSANVLDFYNRSR